MAANRCHLLPGTADKQSIGDKNLRRTFFNTGYRVGVRTAATVWKWDLAAVNTIVAAE